jgi:hypothetical protein
MGRVVTLAIKSARSSLAQEREDGGRLRYHARLRTTDTTSSSEPALETPERSLTPDLVR